MRLDRSSLIAASDALLSAAALDGCWEEPLDRLAAAAGCHSASVWASRTGRPTYVGNRSFSENGAARMNRPGDVPYSEDVLIPATVNEGFVALDLHPHGDRVRRMPFYIDIMTKAGFGRWASHSLDPGDGSRLKVVLYRDIHDISFTEEQIAALNLTARDIRAAVASARRSGDMAAREKSSAYASRGEPTFLLRASGEVVPDNAEAEGLTTHLPLSVRRGRLVATFDEETRRLDRIVGEAIRPEGRPGSMVLTSSTGDRHQLLVLPLRGQSLDVFCSTRAIATLVRIGGGRDARLDSSAAVLLSTGFDLTERETEVAMMVAGGATPSGIARRLGIGEGTTRNHVKAVLRKVGVHGQVELTALVARYH